MLRSHSWSDQLDFDR